jgi:23S rRNA pseudouridine2605 synthase
VCSRAEGLRLVEAGRVRVNGRVIRDTSARIAPERDVIEIDGAPIVRAARVYLALNKPRGLVTTRDDPQGRATIYECLVDAELPFVAPVGRLDKASEGLLLLTNDSRWSAKLLDPTSHVEKTYHVQLKGLVLSAARGWRSSSTKGRTGTSVASFPSSASRYFGSCASRLVHSHSARCRKARGAC